MIEGNKAIEIKNNVNHTVGIDCPNLRFSRTWEKKGTIRKIPFETLQDIMYEPGVETLFVEGYLVIDDLEVKKELGLEPDDATEPVNIIILTDNQKDNLLKNKLFNDFKKTIETLHFSQICELADYAIDKEILLSYEKNQYFIERVNKNVNTSIENAHKIKED